MTRPETNWRAAKVDAAQKVLAEVRKTATNGILTADQARDIALRNGVAFGDVESMSGWGGFEVVMGTAAREPQVRREPDRPKPRRRGEVSGQTKAGIRAGLIYKVLGDDLSDEAFVVTTLGQWKRERAAIIALMDGGAKP